jgi:hypothetical protein
VKSGIEVLQGRILFPQSCTGIAGSGLVRRNLFSFMPAFLANFEAARGFALRGKMEGLVASLGFDALQSGRRVA